MAPPSNQPERPRAEPEIIPPGRQDNYGRPQGFPNGFPPYGFQQGGARRVYVGRIGPLGFALMLLVLGLLGGVFLLALIGAALIWLPIIAGVVVIAALARIWRQL
jgi:hypothetical protein